MPKTLLQPGGILALGAGVTCGAFALPDSGVSPEAFSLQNSFREYASHLETSESLFGDKAQLISQLNELCAECSEDDWDGYGAEAVSETVSLCAEAFIRALPDGMAMPEISAEPDGQIAFDWLPSKTKTFTLSVSSSDRLAYAWIDGSNRGHAVDLFEGDKLPPRVLGELQRILA
jgi:hypothetical protein